MCENIVKRCSWWKNPLKIIWKNFILRLRGMINRWSWQSINEWWESFEVWRTTSLKQMLVFSWLWRSICKLKLMGIYIRKMASKMNSCKFREGIQNARYFSSQNIMGLDIWCLQINLMTSITPSIIMSKLHIHRLWIKLDNPSSLMLTQER